jgi:hypothetical protein
MLQTVVHYCGREGRKILRTKYRKQFGIGHMFIQTFFLRMTDTMTSQNIELSSWDTLYIEACSNFNGKLLKTSSKTPHLSNLKSSERTRY